MSVSPLIPSKPNLSPGEDFESLLQEGIEIIQQLSGKVWTDYNAHDPGITILETLCYTITEITLKAKLDIQDIIGSSIPTAKNGLYAANEILPSKPTTLTDYRKLLIDITGVKNCWLLPIPANEVDNINGLYDIYIELDEDNNLGDLNSSIIDRTVTVATVIGPQDYTLEFSFPYWDDSLIIGFNEIITVNSILSPGEASVILSSSNPNDPNDYFANLEVTYNTTETATFGITISVSPAVGNDPVVTGLIETEIITLLMQVVSGGPGDIPVITEFNQKVTAANTIKTQVADLIVQNRNLCEDFAGIKAVRIQEIAVYANVKLLKKVNIEKYLAKLYQQLEEFFNPPLNKESLDELLEQDIAIESIFEGPLMSHGFLQDNVFSGKYNLENDQNQGIVFVSDLSHILIETAQTDDGTSQTLLENQILALESLSISNFIRNSVVQANARDCLALARPELYKPRFSLNKSRFRFYREGTEIGYNSNLVGVLWNELRTSLQQEVDFNQIVALPEGNSLDVSDYVSIQYDFPPLYGLADNNLPDSTTSAQHKAQVEQLRAYLTTFDHILASYSNQLYHINELFSIDEDSANTYFKQTLYEIPHLQKILNAYLNSSITSWDAFTAVIDNSYQNLLSSIFETPDIFLDRRNRFLDHMLARFGMSLDKYSTYRFAEEAKNVSNSSEIDLRENEISFDLIADKTRILQYYPQLSQKRFNAFDYNSLAWNTENISGLSQRLLNLFGLQNTLLRTLSSEYTNFIQVNAAGGGQFNYQILDSNSNPVLVSSVNYPGQPEAQSAAEIAIRMGVVRDNFRINEVIVGSDTTYEISLENGDADPPVTIANHASSFSDEMQARRFVRSIMRELTNIGTGVYIIEHILLRPDPENAFAESLIIPFGDPPVAISDPYSFHISIVLPSGYEKDIPADGDPIASIPATFRDSKFRDYAEGLIKEEVPSHIISHIIWLNRNTGVDAIDTPSLQNFENRWRLWLEARADPLIPDNTLNIRRNRLVRTLNSMF